MNQPPKTLVSADELVEYINTRNVSEKAATGLKLMRRAAETIAYLAQEWEKEKSLRAHHAELSKYWGSIAKNTAIALNGDEENVADDYPFKDMPEAIKAIIDQANQPNDTLDQVAHALGADFHEKHQIYGLNEILQHIADMHVQLDGLQQGIIERDQMIDDLEKPVTTGPASGIEIKFAKDWPSTDAGQDPDQSVGCGDTIDRHKWIKEATNLAHKVFGLTLGMEETRGTMELRSIAEHIIDKSPAN